MSSLYESLKSGSTSTPQSDQYSFNRGTPTSPTASPFRPGGARPTTQTQPDHGPRHFPDPQNRRTDDGDRPAGFMPPAVVQPGTVTEWRPPGLKDILLDLGLRMLEVGIQAAALEVAYFFTRRRFQKWPSHTPPPFQHPVP